MRCGGKEIVSGSAAGVAGGGGGRGEHTEIGVANLVLQL